MGIWFKVLWDSVGCFNAIDVEVKPACIHIMAGCNVGPFVEWNSEGVVGSAIVCA